MNFCCSVVSAVLFNAGSFSQCVVLIATYRAGLRFQYSTQTTHSNRGPLDFLLRVSTGSDAEPVSGDTDEVSDSEEERQNRENLGSIHAAGVTAALNASQPASLVTPPLQQTSATGRPSFASLMCFHRHTRIRYCNILLLLDSSSPKVSAQSQTFSPLAQGAGVLGA